MTDARLEGSRRRIWPSVFGIAGLAAIIVAVVIPAGSAVIFDGKCAGAGQFELRISRLTSVPAMFLPPELRAQLRM